MNYMEFDWKNLGPDIHAHVSVNLNENGDIVSSYYNLGDSTGDHEFPKRNSFPKKYKQYKDDLLMMRHNATKKAILSFAYAETRKRNTSDKDLEYCFLVTEGRGGYSIYIDNHPSTSTHISGYGRLSKERIAEINRLKIPYIDTTTIPDDLIWMTVRFPLIPDKPIKYENSPYGGFSYAPIEVLAYLEHSIGATVFNIDMKKVSKEELSENLVKVFEEYGQIDKLG